MAPKACWAKETELRELREENKRLKKEGRKSSVQFELAGEEGIFKKDGMMVVDEEVDNKKNLDQRKKELQKTCARHQEVHRYARGHAECAQRHMVTGPSIS